MMEYAGEVVCMFGELGWLGVLAALLTAVGVVEYVVVLLGWRAEDERRARDEEIDREPHDHPQRWAA
jgi:hypothetical protein